MAADRIDIDQVAQNILKEKQEPEMDEDGYAVGDPYSDMAKAIDKRDANPSLRVRLGKAILDNQDSVKLGERALKTIFGLGGLIYLVNSYEFSDKEKQKLSQASYSDLLASFTN